MKQLVIFTDDPGWHGARLKQALKNRGYDGVYVSLTKCRLSVDAKGNPDVGVPGFDDRLPLGVFVRGVPGGSLEEVVFFLNILHGLEKLGVPVYNSGQGIERTVDKALTSFLLAANGIKTPHTTVIREPDDAFKYASSVFAAGLPLVMKPLFGSQGEGVQLLHSLEALKVSVPQGGIYYFQEFIETSGGFSDLRVFVIAGKAVAAMRRYGSSWLNNVAQGARCEAAVVTAKQAQLAEAAVACVGLRYGGVDIITAVDGTDLVIEVNSIPAWKGLQSVTDFDVTELLVSDFIKYSTEIKASVSCA